MTFCHAPAKSKVESHASSVRHDNVILCVDVEFLKSLTTLGILKDAETYKDLTDEEVQNFLYDRCTESNLLVTLEKLDEIIDREL